jgi:hypothetical protein
MHAETIPASCVKSPCLIEISSIDDRATLVYYHECGRLGQSHSSTASFLTNFLFLICTTPPDWISRGFQDLPVQSNILAICVYASRRYAPLIQWRFWLRTTFGYLSMEYGHYAPGVFYFLRFFRHTRPASCSARCFGHLVSFFGNHALVEISPAIFLCCSSKEVGMTDARERG